MRVVTHQPQRVAAFVAQRTDCCQFHPPYQAIGWEGEDGTLLGGAVFNNYTGANIEVSLAGRGAMTRQAFRDMARYVFGQLRVRRVTAHCKAQGNARLINQAVRGGFAKEGFRSRWFLDDDGVALVMFPEHCKWK